MSGTVGILPPAETQFLDANGVPLAGGSVTTYAPGTTVLAPTYQDSAGTIANPNPVPLDSAGRAIIWGSGAFRTVVKDVNGNLIWDQVTASAGNDHNGAIPVRVFSTPLTVCQVQPTDGFVEVNVPAQAVTVSLPSLGGPFTIIDGAAQALVYPITVQSGSGTTLGVINTSGGSMTFAWNGTVMVRVDIQADAVPLTVATGISAAGATQNTATVLTASRNIVVTSTSGSGVVLSTDFAEIVVFNRSANTVSVYPPIGMSIETLGTNGAAGVSVGQSTTFLYDGSDKWYVR